MTDQLVLVTGASGFIASHVVQQLQQAGYRVRGTVRSLENEAKNEPLKKLVPDAKYPLELVAADLTSEDGWNKAAEGCYAVIHTASPFPNVAEKKIKEEELLVPAKQGTCTVLKAAAEAGVKKVVLTSSFASVFAEAVAGADKKFSEEDWSDPESTTIDFYSKSKVVAEKAAWDFVKDLPEDKRFSLSVVNPVFVMGPPLLECHKSATSVGFMIDMLNQKLPGLPKVMMAFCDVRDVAKAHVECLSNTAAADKRHIVFSECLWIKDSYNIVAKEFKPQGYKVTTTVLPYFFVWLTSFFMEPVKSYILPRIGATFQVDNSRMVNTLGITPTMMEKSLVDMAYAVIDMNLVAKSKKYKQVGSRAVVPEPEKAAEQEQQAEELPAKEPPVEDKKEELEPEDKEKSNEVATNEENKAEEVKSS